MLHLPNLQQFPSLLIQEHQLQQPSQHLDLVLLDLCLPPHLLADLKQLIPESNSKVQLPQLFSSLSDMVWLVQGTSLRPTAHARYTPGLSLNSSDLTNKSKRQNIPAANI